MKTFSTQMARRVFAAVATTLVLSCILCACKTDYTGIENEKLNSSLRETYNVKYLSFKDFKEFHNAVHERSQLPYSKQKAVTTDKSFTSLQDLYMRALAEEEQAFKEEAITGPINLKELPVARQYKNAFIFPLEGGIELNLADLSMAPFLNQDGIVKIGKMVYQFTKDKTKGILDKENNSENISIMLNANKNDSNQNLFIHPVHINRKEISTLRVSDYWDSESCESTSGSPQKWRLIAYAEETELSAKLYEPASPYADVGGFVNTNWNRLLLTIRTLKRGTFGAWFDRASKAQSASGIFSSSGDFSNPTYYGSDLGLVNPNADMSIPSPYSISNANGAEIATWQIHLLAFRFLEPYDYPRNIRFTPGSTHNAVWGLDYNCACTITNQ